MPGDIRAARHSTFRSVSTAVTSAIMDVQATIKDPNTLTQSITIKFTELLIPNTDILENFCTEGERDRAHMPVGNPVR